MSSSRETPRYNATFDRFVVGENGTLEYSFSAVGDAVVALFFRLVRDLPDEQLCADFDQCLRASLLPLASATYASQAQALRDVFDPRRVAEDLFLLAFQTRDCRGGKGERVLFHKMFLLLAVHYPRTCAALVPLISEYGYWKDVFLLLAIIDALSSEAQQRVHALAQRLVDVVAKQLRTDFAKVDEMLRRESERECVREENGECVEDIEAEIAEEREQQEQQQQESLVKNNNKGSNKKQSLSLSLASKYAPREKHAFYRDHKRVFYRLLDAIFPEFAGDHVQQKQLYRRSLSRCTAHLEIAESKMCAQRFSEISFASLPAVCLRKNSKALLNELPHRAPLTAEQRERGNRYPDNEDRVQARKNLLEALSRPESVKGAMLFPHELARKFLPGNRNRDVREPSSAEKLVIEAQWRHLRESVRLRVASVSEKDSVSLSRLIPLVDVSGSMSGTPMEVAIALGILISEISSEAFRDRLLTFSSVPTWIDLSETYSLEEKVRLVSRAPWGMSTDIEKAMDLISQVVLSHRLSEEEIPDLIIFSDMQFDAATRFDATQEQKIRERFHNLGMEIAGKPFEAPRIVFWNLRGNTSGFPATASSENVQLLSGYSPSLFNALVDGALDESLEDVQEKGEKKKKKKVTPYDTVRRILDHERYDAVREVLRKSSEGALGLPFTNGVPSCGKAIVETEEKTTRVRRLGSARCQASSLYDYLDLDDDSQFFSKTKPKRKPCDKKLRRAMRSIGRSGSVAKKDVVKFL